MIRVSAISFLNTVPLLRGMGKEQHLKLEIGFTSPAECAEQLRAGRADAGLIPAIEYQRIPGLVVLGDAAIATRGAVRSILLLSRLPLEQVRTVAMDTASRTSVALTQVIYHLRFGRSVETLPHVADPGAMLKAADAALVIGDPALHYAQAPLEKVAAYDLGAEWKALTGKPFVFAFWAARQEAATAELAEMFNRWRDLGVADIERLVAEEAPRRGLPPEIVRAYLTRNIHFTLDAACLEGLREFYRLAREIGLTARNEELEWIKAGAPAIC